MDDSVTTIGTQEGYDQWSAFYDQDDNPLIRLDHQEIDPRLVNLAGKQVLDVGCGTGRHAIPLANSGAEVTGIDFSDGMLSQARDKPGASNVAWLCQDLASAWSLGNNTFDLVLSCLVLEHVREVNAFFREMARVCKPEGTVLISAMHPNMFLKGTRAGYKTANGRQHRIDGETHGVGDYITAGLEAGLTLQWISERTPDQFLEDSQRARKYAGWHLFLGLEFRLGSV